MSQNPLDIPLKELQKRILSNRRELLARMGALGLEFIHENFQKQGFQGEVFDPWKPRKHPDKKRPGRAILVDSAILKNANRIVRIGIDEVVLGNSTPYAQIHNEGGSINHPQRTATLSFRFGKGGKLKLAKVQTLKQRARVAAQVRATIGEHTTHMPKREFIGASPVLNRRIIAMIYSVIIK